MTEHDRRPNLHLRDHEGRDAVACQPDEAGLSRSAELTLRATNQQINSPRGLGGVFAPNEVRQVRRQLQQVRGEQVADLAIHQVRAAAAQKVLDARLQGERWRSEIRQAQNAQYADLASQATELAALAMRQQVACEEENQRKLANSRCTEQDKAMLSELLSQLAQRQIRKTAAEHGAELQPPAEEPPGGEQSEDGGFNPEAFPDPEGLWSTDPTPPP